ncbi:ligase-associated DNA damage response endonuclease PdeM [Luteibacter aegosomatis]|uniref:ligase-associated DNA damage response endonuclease PdeM n=1 Tax=Luteibacter aegosomatis TaxID=2911537 RepID=UPI001FFA5CAA|nr:ligase-associated DNA damage response endonuclease PdeM [Luteibacter aegosomatis]UPG84207.1 ligase-associated DNA damage response endonuclease PdeM [Luteibacter aegosomatis]
MTHGIEVAGERLDLHAERAVFWPAKRILFVADVHFGKGAVFRRAGIAVPSGDTDDDLARLDALIAWYAPAQIVVLGDLVHGAPGRHSDWVERVRAWRARHGDVRMRLVAGNHDRHMDARLLGFELCPDRVAEPPFVLSHDPRPDERGYVLAGHVHPGVVVRDGWRKHRLPAFVFDASVGVLPAFGTMTGLHEVIMEPKRRIVAVTPGGLLPLTSAQGSRTGSAPTLR